MSTIEDLCKARATFVLRFPWRDKTAGASGCEEVRVFSGHPRSHYGRFRFSNRAFAPTQEDAKSTAFSALSRVAFIDATGWQRSKSTNVVFALTGQAVWPAGFACSTVWRCPGTKRLLLTTEPLEQHLAMVEAECAARGWPFHVFAPGVGMRKPPDARLVLASPQGVQLEPVIAALERAMPRRRSR
jgi:hypothetical protein